MNISTLITRCASNDAEAWDILCAKIKAAALPTIRRVFYGMSRGFDRSVVDDVLQELYLYLLENRLLRLRRFRGTTDAEFSAYVRTIARRLTGRLARRWCAARQREREVIEHLRRRADCSVPLDQRLRFLLAQITTSMTDGERAAFEAVVEAASDAPLPESDRRSTVRLSAQALRRLLERLFDKYGDLL